MLLKYIKYILPIRLIFKIYSTWEAGGDPHARGEKLEIMDFLRIIIFDQNI